MLRQLQSAVDNGGGGSAVATALGADAQEAVDALAALVAVANRHIPNGEAALTPPIVQGDIA
jgi:hypothetical protein